MNILQTFSYMMCLLGLRITAGEELYDQHIQQIEHHPPSPYDFGYKMADEWGNTQFRHESSNGKGTVVGSYGYTDKEGLYRKVVYVADKWGYRATVQTNEPGTANQNPADVLVKAQKPPFVYKPLNQIL